MTAERSYPSSPGHGASGEGQGGRRPVSRRRDGIPGRRIPRLALKLELAWRERTDVEESLPLARAISDELVDGPVDLIEDYGGVCLAAECLWDAETGRNAEALELAERWRLRVKRLKDSDVKLTDLEVTALDVRAYRLTIRALHRKPDPRRAWAVIRVAYRALCERAGGATALSTLAATSPFDGLGLLYSELLGIAPAVARRLPEAVTGPLGDVFMRDAETIARQIPVGASGFTNLHALVNQLLFAVLERNTPQQDTGLVQLLYLLDVKTTRPRDARGQATVHNLFSAIAAYFGEDEKAKLYAKRARSHLRAASLLRHAEVIDARYPLGR